MTRKKAMQDAKTKFDTLEIGNNAIMQKMNDMEVFVNNPVPSIESKSDGELTQVELEEMALFCF